MHRHRGYTVIFTPDDIVNYNTVEATIEVLVNKATPVQGDDLTAAEITYGQTLKDAIITSGSAKYSDSDDTIVAGTYQWADGNIAPSVSDSNTTPYSITFIPEDQTNYNSFTTTLMVTVNKAVNVPKVPDTVMKPDSSIKTVGDVVLPEGWSWRLEDRNKELVDDKAVTAIAVYTGANADNYENKSVEITLTRVKANDINAGNNNSNINGNNNGSGNNGNNNGDTAGTKNDDNATKTGDSNDIWRYIWMLTIGGVIIIVGFETLIVKKRKEEN